MTSIVILAVDRAALLRRCLESVAAHTTAQHELVIVLNGATAAVAELAERWPHPAKQVIVLSANLGVTPGRNMGMQYARGEFVLFLDDDAWVSEDPAYLRERDRAMDWLARMERYFADPLVGVVSQSGSYIHPREPGNFWACVEPGAECDVGMGYCFMFRRRLIEEIGFLDPVFGRFWHEESEYALRAKAAGYKVIHAGYIGVSHAGAGSGDDGTYGQKIAYLWQKWSGEFPRILVPRERWRVK